MKRSLKVWKEISKSTWKLENKWTEYTKELMKEIPIGKCAEAGDKCNSVIRTVGENWAWWDMRCESQIPSW